VKADSKQRYDLILESLEGVKLEVVSAPVVATLPSESGPSTSPSLSVDVSETAASIVADTGKDGIWWIKARQGHSIKVSLCIT
jgi:hypothetical protein